MAANNDASQLPENRSVEDLLLDLRDMSLNKTSGHSSFPSLPHDSDLEHSLNSSQEKILDAIEAKNAQKNTEMANRSQHSDTSSDCKYTFSLPGFLICTLDSPPPVSAGNIQEPPLATSARKQQSSLTMEQHLDPSMDPDVATVTPQQSKSIVFAYSSYGSIYRDNS